jgi:hypothetical protein
MAAQHSKQSACGDASTCSIHTLIGFAQHSQAAACVRWQLSRRRLDYSRVHSRFAITIPHRQTQPESSAA